MLARQSLSRFRVYRPLAARTLGVPHVQRRTKVTGRVAQVAGTAGNVLLIGSIVTMFGYIAYTLYDNLLAENGVTRVYNESLDLVRASPDIRSIFGSSIRGFGEPTHGQRQRQRAIAHREYMDNGQKRLALQYNVEASRDPQGVRGVVRVDMGEAKKLGTWDFNSIVVDVYRDNKVQKTVDVLVTNEYKRESQKSEKEQRNRMFAPRGNADGSWFGILRTDNWRK
ncbi:Mitochondrial import inner membrane translocase subunit Tim21 [Coemansia sp. RSA 1287]|nr:Mitochondrial import inner membrane translocase subunit Tim21 [Coemansia sp. RSA 564]KAJ2184060.1 Mitochondrial import inner membrane translocase subunit Tim21 [Coemansia sp. RSA 532]KAJ2407920.1 Mitochondrial import inner membrane translocase subunit Tim21 [Coemansia sp. RSA 2526]KAJ2630423.1 Mitochondrial import inner membrane translocase subunit Tim21 [Coemansia sp. RSA 1287]